MSLRASLLAYSFPNLASSTFLGALPWRKPGSFTSLEDSIIAIKAFKSEVVLHLWGAFSMGGKGVSLSRHSDLLQNGAVGLAEDDFFPPIEILRQGFSLGDMKNAPVLIAPRDMSLQGKGISRESIESYRAGWAPDPIESEIVPLSQILEIHKKYPEIAILKVTNIALNRGGKISIMYIMSILIILICFPITSPNKGGTAFPIWRFLLVLLPKKMNSSGKPCSLAPSLVDKALF